MTYRKWNYFVGFTFLIVSLLVGALNYIVDPLQFYRKAFYPPFFSSEQRYQNPGLARNYDYNSIIIGTSVTENFLPSQINDKLGFEALKLSISGSTAKEQRLITNVAIKTGKVKNVIWGIDYIALIGSTDRVADEYGPFPYYLYDDNFYSKVNYLLNISTTRESLKILPVILSGAQPHEPNLELLFNWNSAFEFSKASVVENWHIFEYMAFDPDLYARQNLIDNFRYNILPVVRENRDTNFFFFFPPYSILLQKVYYNNHVFNDFMYIKSYIVRTLSRYPNVKIYDFQDLDFITHNLDNYKDAMHYSGKINEYIIESIAADQHRLTTNNYEKRIQSLTSQVKRLELNKMLGN